MLDFRQTQEVTELSPKACIHLTVSSLYVERAINAYQSAAAYQILYLEEQVEFHSPRLNDSLNNTKLLSFSGARR